jgi:fluoride exporter
MTGSVARYGLSLLLQRSSLVWPAGTFASNLLGCLCIGLIAELATRSQAISPEARLLLATGFCGGFTTMSSFVYESAQMLSSGEYLHAGLYFGGTLIGSMIAFLAGVMAIRIITQAPGGLWN